MTRTTRVSCAVLVGAFVLVVMATNCAKRIPEPFAGEPGAPRVGWVIMYGDRDNPDRDFVCQSNPRSECVIPVTGSGEPVFGHAHLYYHPATMETKYTGSVTIAFLQGGAAANEIRPNITVKPGEPVGNSSISGVVATTPGTYKMTVAVTATSSQTGETRTLRDEVNVSVK